jgi:hypothetical protein
MGDERLQVVGFITMKNAVNGVMTGYVFDLTSAEIVARC